MNLTRPLCFFCVAFILGIVLCSFLSLYCFLFFLLILLFVILLCFNKLYFSKGFILIFIIFLLSGGILYTISENSIYGKFEEYDNKVIHIEGYIDSEIEKDKDGKIKFILNTIQIEENESFHKIRGKLMVHISSGEIDELGYRSKVSFISKIEKPKPATNPGGFDYRRYLATIGVSGTIYLRSCSELDEVGFRAGGWLQRVGYSIKNKFLNTIEYCLDENQAGLLSGMLIGYKDGLDEYAYSAFSKAGLTHIMVASGMNVAFIILPVAFLFKKLRFSNLAANIATIGVLIMFVFVTGFSASVARAVIMGIIILISKIIMRETDIYTSISMAAIILLVINPFSLFDIGFQLSFGATISLVLFYPKLKLFFDKRYIPNLVSDTLAATLAAQIGVVPITLYYFNNFSTISILSNVLVVPLVQIITIIGFIMVFVGLINIHFGILIAYVNNTFLSFVLFITEYTAKIPYASLKLPTPPVTLIVVYYALILYLFMGRELLKTDILHKLIIQISISGLVLAIIINVIIPNPLEVTFLDVGQGDCAFIKTAKGTKVLIDGGGREANSKSKFDIGESVVVPYILDKHTKKIDIVIATHGHADHTEGLEAVLGQLNVGTLILPDTNGEGFEKLIKICNDKRIKIMKCKFGDIIRLDKDTLFEVFNPLPMEQDILSGQSLNESSLVLKLIYKEVDILFTGDSGIPVEERMLKQGIDLRTKFIKIGHHGSPGSTSLEFVNSVRPEYAVFSVGRNNFGHPSQFVIDRLAEAGTELYRTDEQGAINIKSYGKDFSIKTMLTK